MSFTLLTRCDTFSSSVTCLQGGLVIVSARYGTLEDILTHERSHASSSEEASTTPESTHRPEETQPHSRGAAGLPLALRICYCCRLTHGLSMACALGRHLWHSQHTGASSCSNMAVVSSSGCISHHCCVACIEASRIRSIVSASCRCRGR